MPRTASFTTPKQKKSEEMSDVALERISQIMKHGADPTRIKIINILSKEETNVGGICTQLNHSQPAISHHLCLMRHGGVVSPRREGKNNFYSLTELGIELAQCLANVAAQVTDR